MNNIQISESAQAYLLELLNKQEVEGIAIRIFISQPGTPHAETCVAYCKPDEQKEGDEQVPCEGFDAWLDERSLPFLEDATVDYNKDRFGGQLTIKAPNSKVPTVNEDSPMEDRINYFLYAEVNPGLASHGGNVTLMELIEDETVAILQFGGGCQGCSQVDLTLKEGVERTLLDAIPELKAVRDLTDHTVTENAYFK